MTVTVDANVIAALLLPTPISSKANQIFWVWKSDRVEVISPRLCEYELTSAFRKAVSLNILSQEVAQESVIKINEFGLRFIDPTPELHRRAIWWAGKINQPVAYDAQYLSVAEQFGTTLWTADRRLFLAAKSTGIKWVEFVHE